MAFFYDRISIQILRQNKQYGAKEFLKEFSQKEWSSGGLKKYIRNIETTRTAARCPGSGRRHTVDNINDVSANSR